MGLWEGGRVCCEDESVRVDPAREELTEREVLVRLCCLCHPRSLLCVREINKGDGRW